MRRECLRVHCAACVCTAARVFALRALRRECLRNTQHVCGGDEDGGNVAVLQLQYLW